MTYDFHWFSEMPYWTFEDAVQTPVDEFAHEWKRYWGIGATVCPEHLDPDDWEVANEMHEVARRICHTTTDLQGRRLPEGLRTLPGVLQLEARDERRSRSELARQIREKMTPEQLELAQVRDVLAFLEWQEGEAEAKEKLFRTAVQMYAYPAFGMGPGEVTDRLLDLLEFLMRTSGERSREYLRRVAVCYIRDMPPELAVMSRSVMESALALDVVEARVERNLRVKGKRYGGLAGWVEAAYEEGVLTEAGRAAADFVKNAGDDAVHNAPQAVPAAELILRHLRTVLQEIEGFEKGWRRDSGA